jgi:molybdate transport system ATP-binding protein
MTHVRVSLTVWKPVRFTLEAEFPLARGLTALVGPAASGKSLLLKCIAGFERPDSGRVMIDDAIVFDAQAKVNLRPRFRQAAFLPQTDTMFPKMTVRQNLMFAAEKWARLERHKRVAEMAERFELAQYIESMASDLTPRQRVSCALARALLAEPKVLLIDECGIQEAQVRQVRDAFSCPVLLATGNLDLCYAAAGEMILLQGGRIVQRGPAQEVMEKPESADAARLAGFENIFAAEVVGLDPGRNTSLLKCDAFELSAPYLPGHFKGDRVTIAIRAEDVQVHSGEIEAGENFLATELKSISESTRHVRLEFAAGLLAEVRRFQWLRQRDNRSWQVELPPAALRVF